MVNYMVNAEGRLCGNWEPTKNEKILKNRLAIRFGIDFKETMFVDVMISTEQTKGVYCYKGDLVTIYASQKITCYNNKPYITLWVKDIRGKTKE